MTVTITVADVNGDDDEWGTINNNALLALEAEINSEEVIRAAAIADLQSQINPIINSF